MLNFDESLSGTLALYTQPPEENTQSLFSAHREISIARLALENQARAYFTGLQILNRILENAQLQSQVPGANLAKITTDVMMAVNAIELRSEKLIQSAKLTTELLAEVLNLDFDKASLHALLLSIPSLLRETIQDPVVLGRVQEKLDNALKALRFNPQASDQMQNNAIPCITVEQYNEMLESVP